MANSTMLQIPNNITDEVTLRRVLTSIVQALDEIRGNRGTGEAATTEQLAEAKSVAAASASTSLGELATSIESLDTSYLKRDGSNTASAPLSYAASHTLSGLNFCDVATVGKLVDAKVTPVAAPALLNGNTDVAIMSAKIDEVITALVATKVFI